MSVDTLLSLIGILGFLFLIAHGRAQYWKGKFESLNSERPEDGGGWREETLFLRRLVNKDAAEGALEDKEEHY